MKKIAELSLSVGSNNHLLGINEKYDLLFIQKGKELILFPEYLISFSTYLFITS